MKSIKLLALTLVLSLLVGCALFPAAKTVADKALCNDHFSERMSISLEDAARFYCDNRAILDIFAECNGDEACLKAAGPKVDGLMGISDE